MDTNVYDKIIVIIINLLVCLAVAVLFTGLTRPSVIHNKR